MAVKTKTQLKTDFSDNTVATGAKFADLIDSLKAVQAAVSDPTAAGTSVTFIATIEQNENGEITVTKKTVNFNGYQTTSGMAVYQVNDKQQVKNITVGAGASQAITHNMNHYPTVRILNTDTGFEESDFEVKHDGVNALTITLGGSMVAGTYKYILD